MIRTAFEDNPEKAMSKALETEFDEAMMGVYRQALSECDYKATRFLHMLHEHRGLQTARILLHAAIVSESFTALWERKRLDLAVEAVILNPQWEACSQRKSRLLRGSVRPTTAIRRVTGLHGSNDV